MDRQATGRNTHPTIPRGCALLLAVISICGSGCERQRVPSGKSTERHSDRVTMCAEAETRPRYVPSGKNRLIVTLEGIDVVTPPASFHAFEKFRRGYRGTRLCATGTVAVKDGLTQLVVQDAADLAPGPFWRSILESNGHMLLGLAFLGTVMSMFFGLWAQTRRPETLFHQTTDSTAMQIADLAGRVAFYAALVAAAAALPETLVEGDVDDDGIGGRRKPRTCMHCGSTVSAYDAFCKCGRLVRHHEWCGIITLNL